MARIGVTGHQHLVGRINEQGARHSEADAWNWVKHAFCDVLKDDAIVMTGLAVGSDQLLSQLALDRGAQIEVLVPSADYDTTFNGDELALYIALLARALKVIHLNYPEPSEEAYYAAGKYIVDHSDFLVAVWDGREAEGLGGTGDIVNYARSKGRSVLQLDPIRLEVSWSSSKE